MRKNAEVRILKFFQSLLIMKAVSKIIEALSEKPDILEEKQMIGTGTIINITGIIAGGAAGHFFGKLLSENHQDTLSKTCGICVLFIGIAGAMEGMMAIEGNSITSGKSMLVVACLVIGAMAIVGAMQDGIWGDYSILATKAVLDLVIIMVMTSSMGKGCVFSAVPVAVLQGSITLLARFIKPFMTEAALSNISLIGSILIFCVGLNLVWGKKVRVANLLPALVVAVIMAFLPINL